MIIPERSNVQVYSQRVLLAIAALVMFVADSHGIIIRHDQPDSSYIALGSRYDAAVSIKPDGMGTLIGPQWVLTAAHVIAGAADRGAMTVEIDGEFHAVERVFIHPDWDRTGPHDIGLLQLAKPVETVKPVKMYESTAETGLVATFVGEGDFGNGRTGPTAGPGTRRGATNVIDSVDGNWVYFTFDSSASATELEGVSGPGDSGGPAFITQDGETLVAGVSVASAGNGGPGRYGITELYSRVSTHHDWLSSIVNGSSSDTGFAVSGMGSDSNRVQSRTKGLLSGAAQAVPTTPHGRLVASYLNVYNRGADSIMTMFIRARFTPEYFAEKELAGHIETYHTLYHEHFGRLSYHELIEQTDDSITFLCQSEKGPIAEIKMTISNESRPRVGGIRVAIVSID